MRSRLTWLVVAAVAGLALAAIVDVVAEEETHPDGEVETVSTLRAATASPVETPSAAALRKARVSGTLHATFRRGPRCEYRATALPSLELLGSGVLQRCRFAVSPDGRYVAEVARCPDNRASLLWDRSHPAGAYAFRGCSAAWRPDGRLTYLLRGRIVVAKMACLGRRGCPDVAVSRAALARAARRAREADGADSVRQIAWLTASRLALVVQIRRNSESIVLFDGRGRARIVGAPDFVFPLHSHLEVVRERKEIFIGGRGYGGFAVFDFSGDFIDANRIPFQDAGATAHSPDRRWIALARPGNVCIYARNGSRSSVGCIRGDAQDLAWR